MKFVTVNLQSVKINIPTVNADQWERILERNFGSPVDRSNSSNGKQYKTSEGVSITIWKKKEETSTILINGKKEYLKFCIDEIPKLFNEFKAEFEVV